MGRTRRDSKRIKSSGDDLGATGLDTLAFMHNSSSRNDDHGNGYDSGTEQEQARFKQDVKVFHMERGIAFKPPKFYKEEVNLLKLWKVVRNMGGYDHVTSAKLWRNVGELFNPPKTCTTLAFAFRGLYQKALLEYEKHKTLTSSEGPKVKGLRKRNSDFPKVNRDTQISSKSGRPPRNSAIRAKQVWQSLKVSSSHSDENKVEDLTDDFNENEIRSKILARPQEIEKEQKMASNISLPKHPKEPNFDQLCIPKEENLSSSYTPDTNVEISDIGRPTNWVKINVYTTSDGFEVFALIPGFSQDDVQIQYDDGGHIVILGQPENPDDDPWGIFPFKKVIKLPSRINPHKTAAVVTLLGQLFIRAPFEQSSNA